MGLGENGGTPPYNLVLSVLNSPFNSTHNLNHTTCYALHVLDFIMYVFVMMMKCN